jgi:hypothetical protein
MELRKIRFWIEILLIIGIILAGFFKSIFAPR